MKDLGIVLGDAQQAKPLVINNNLVYVHTDIKKGVDETYEYHEYQYTLPEFLSELVAQIERLTTLLTSSSEILTDSQKMEIAGLYTHWTPGHKYTAGEIVKSGLNKDGEPQLYQVVQEHTSQEDWMPQNTPALYKAIGFTDSSIPIWTQPLGATDAYAVGDKVAHNDKIWISDVDSNVWEPGVYGWTEVTE
jgi:hypothetical protein